MARTHTVIFEGGAQSIRTIAVSADNEPKVPSSATYSIVDLRLHEDDADRAIGSGSATVDSASATTDAAAGTGTADKRAISVDAVAGFTEGREYLLSKNGEAESFVLDRIDSSAVTLYARDEIRGTYTTGAAVSGLEVTATFPSDEAADEDRFEEGGGPYAIDWTFVGVTPTRARELIHVRRSDVRTYATVADVLMIDQGIGEVSRKRIKLEVCLAQAHRDYRGHLRELGVDPDDFHGGEQARDAIAYRACALARRQQGTDRDIDMAREYDETFRSRMLRISAQGVALVDKISDEARLDPRSPLSPFKPL